MASSTALYYLLFFTLLSLTPAQLVIYESGNSLRQGPTLQNGASFCPSTFSSTGFSILCTATTTADKAVFYIGGEEVRKESKKPFFIAGDRNGKVFPWRDWEDYDALHAGEVEILCRQSDETETSVTMKFECDEEEVDEEVEEEVKKGMKEGVKEEASPQSQSASLTAKAVPSEGGGAEEVAEEKEVDLEAFNGVKTSASGCVVIDARATRVSGDWEDTGNGVVFRRGGSPGGIARPGESVLEYQFAAPASGQYGLVVDMTTAHKTEHNDIWAQLPGVGFEFRTERGRYEKTKKRGFIKIYQNGNGRSMTTSSIDFDPHSIATAVELERGEVYTMRLGGRSSKVEVHRVILFPCEGLHCHKKDRLWRKARRECANL